MQGNIRNNIIKNKNKFTMYSAKQNLKKVNFGCTFTDFFPSSRKLLGKKSASLRRKEANGAPNQLQPTHTGPMLLTAAKLLQLEKSAETFPHVADGHSCERSRIQDGAADDHSTNLCNCRAAECQGTAV
jgi:hypothetical protein